MPDTQLLTTIRETAPRTTRQTRCLAITGGKGGVGKSNLALNLAFELGALGNHVSLLDADFGLANIDLLCGVSPKFHLGHVISSLKDLEDIRISLTERVSLIPGGSGVEELTKISVNTHPHIFEKLRVLEEEADFMVIDTAAGIAESVVSVLISATEVIVVATPEPTSIVDAYATIKIVLRYAPAKPISIVVNNVVGIGDAEQVFQSLNSAVQNFLGHRIEFLGMIPNDSHIPEAVREQIPLVQLSPDAPSSRAIRLIAKQLFSHKQKDTGLKEVKSFWDMLAQN
ncbi:MAG: MinD/ParA family protein [Acidobacteria bacterium]|nr:MinD/ParA family protein [Acidobacteriota bacterium]